MRVDPAEFEALELRVHEFLNDVPLHDVWRVRLRGRGSDVTVREVVAQLVEIEGEAVNPAVRALFALRAWLGAAFGWDDPRSDSDLASYVGRLTPEDRARSLEEPGSRQGFFKVIYTFEREALGEVINRTVHAFLLFTLAPEEEGHALYWAVYVKPVSRMTSWYMALIDPFRRLIVYPALIRRFERRWGGDV